jgi:release factor glutamine methyltransferase
VVSNPPYIATRDIDTLAREVREHDPRLALDGGVDGLDAYRAISRRVPGLLRDGGYLVVEIGAGQAADVIAILTSTGALEWVATRADLSGMKRAVTVRASGVRGRVTG